MTMLTWYSSADVFGSVGVTTFDQRSNSNVENEPVDTLWTSSHWNNSLALASFPTQMVALKCRMALLWLSDSRSNFGGANQTPAVPAKRGNSWRLGVLIWLAFWRNQIDIVEEYGDQPEWTDDNQIIPLNRLRGNVWWSTTLTRLTRIRYCVTTSWSSVSPFRINMGEGLGDSSLY